MGLYKYYLENRAYFKLEIFSKNLSITAFLMLSTGIISSNLPLVNFLNYYFFGLQRNVVESNNPLAFDEFGVKISWRGIFPSSETVGEFYGLVLLLFVMSGMYHGYRIYPKIKHINEFPSEDIENKLI